MTTYEHGGKQYIAILSGVGGWAGIGLAAGLTGPTEGLGAVGGYAALKNYTSLGGQLTVFALELGASRRTQRLDEKRTMMSFARESGCG